ncbi:DNA (cytosine-5)-methyltransferase [Dirofilaria immitis]
MIVYLFKIFWDAIMQRKLSTKTPYINLSLRLKEFDLKCIPIWHKMDNETYEKQFKLGEAVFAALVEWDSAPVEQTHAVISKLKQDVRNQVVKYTTWIINFIGACTKKKNEINSKMIYDGVNILLRRFQGMDKDFDHCLTLIDQSKEVFLLRKNFK